MVRGRAGGLHDENIFATNVFFDFDEGFAVGERFDGRFADFDADRSANGFAQRLVGCAAKNLHNLSVLSLKQGPPKGGRKAGVTLAMSRSGARTFRDFQRVSIA